METSIAFTAVEHHAVLDGMLSTKSTSYVLRLPWGANGRRCSMGRPSVAILVPYRCRRGVNHALSKPMISRRQLSTCHRTLKDTARRPARVACAYAIASRYPGTACACAWCLCLCFPAHIAGHLQTPNSSCGIIKCSFFVTAARRRCSLLAGHIRRSDH